MVHERLPASPEADAGSTEPNAMAWLAGDLHFRIAADLGLWVNVLKLDPDRSSGTPAPHEMEIYRPSDENYVNARVKLEARYAFARY